MGSCDWRFGGSRLGFDGDGFAFPLGGRLSVGGRVRGTHTAGLLLAALMGCAVAPPPTGLLPQVLSPGQGIPISPSERREARALGRAARALDSGQVAAAEWELALSGRGEALAPYRDYERARLLAAQGDCAGALARTRVLRAEQPEARLAVSLSALAGDCLAELGEETEAREAWTLAFEGSQDPRQRRALGLALIESRQRSGELDPDREAEDLWAIAFPASLEDVDAGVKTPLPDAPLARGDALVARGRSALAAEAYREALVGELSEDERRHAQFELGVALFRLRAYDEAAVEFAVLEGDPEARLWTLRSRARRGYIDEAIEGFEQLAGEAPPELSIRARYLAGILLEDQGEASRAGAHYAAIAANPDFPEQALQSLWRIGWSAWKSGDHLAARRQFERMLPRESDPIAALRPRYWAARAAQAIGRPRQARAEFRVLAREWPLSYYGWRAQQRLGEIRVTASGERPAPGRAAADSADEARLRRAALLWEAGYLESVAAELEPLLGRRCSAEDCVPLGSLLAGIGEYHRAQKLVLAGYPGRFGRGLRPGEEALFWLSWPPAYAELVRASLPKSKRVEPALVWAIMREESGFRPGVMSSAGAMGLLQLMPETARRTAARAGGPALEDSEMLFAPETNIALGSAYLDYLAERFPSHLSAVIASYNAGPTAVAGWRKGAAADLDDDVWVEDIPYAQTRSYVRRVLRSLHAYRSFY